MYMPRNLVLFSPYALPIWLSGTPFIDRLSPVISLLSYGYLITIYLVFPAFRETLLAQNQLYSLLISRFALWYRVCEFWCDNTSDVSSANDKTFPSVHLPMSFTYIR